jgi:hypothetical protein
MNKLILHLIKILHIIYLLFVIITPFSNKKDLMLFHCILVPFMLLHWSINANICCLTLVEQVVRQKMNLPADSKETFIGNLIYPIYEFNQGSEAFNDIINYITFILMFINVKKTIHNLKMKK